MKLLLLFTTLFFSSVLSQRLIFSDEFDEFDLKKWKHELTLGGGGNWEFQWYSNNRTNSFARDGSLYLKPTLTEDHFGEDFIRSGVLDIWGASPANLCTGNAFFGCQRTGGIDGGIINPVKSARVRTAETFSAGPNIHVQISAELPVGDWLWPAIWMMPVDAQYGDWPASGEIDIMESRGNKVYGPGPQGQRGVDGVGSTLHWGPAFEGNNYNMTDSKMWIQDMVGTSDEDFGEGFHEWNLIWTDSGLTTYIDDPSNTLLDIDFTEMSFWERGLYEENEAVWENPWAGRPNGAPFDRDFYLIMNVAVGGTNGFFPDNVGAKPWQNDSPTAATDFLQAKPQWYPTWVGDDVAMKIDYVRVYDISKSVDKEES